ncbi:MAG: hypothetical protein RL097_737, partial [Candidatus Parcubacteria bacterium]
TPRRRASSVEMSTETPAGAPVCASRLARIGLPRLMTARSLLVGAREERTEGWTIMIRIEIDVPRF